MLQYIEGVDAVHKLSDLVMYGIHGVCKIIAVESKIVDKKTVEYYVLEPVCQPGSKYYIPTQNPAALAKLSPILSRNALDNLLNDPEIHRTAWVDDESRRKQHYKELLNGSDRGALIQMAHTLITRRKEQEQLGKKFHQCDEIFLKDALKLLDSEISIIMGIPQKDVRSFMESKF
ncbi:MAG: CarD family transcriptional regulator [Oscillospiraceae bacterium]|nr:CarD family transcriptional regulator [Oscillospiraceae bacterium]